MAREQLNADKQVTLARYIYIAMYREADRGGCAG